MTDDDKLVWAKSAHPTGARVVVVDSDIEGYIGQSGDVIGLDLCLGDETTCPGYSVRLASGAVDLFYDDELRLEQTFTFFW